MTTPRSPIPLMFLAKPDSILVSRGMAGLNNIGMDKTMEIETVHGIRSLTVRGFLEPVGPAKTMSDSLAVMDIYAAQMAFGKEGRIDRIDVSILRGEEMNAVRKRIQAVLPEGYTGRIARCPFRPDRSSHFQSQEKYQQHRLRRHVHRHVSHL